MGGCDEIKKISFSTTMILLRESSHTVAADIIAPGEAERNPGFRNAERTPSAIDF